MKLNKGFTLLELVAVLGLVGGLGFLIAGQSQMLFRNLKQSQTQQELLEVQNNLLKVFSKPESCKLALTNIGIQSELETIFTSSKNYSIGSILEREPFNLRLKSLIPKNLKATGMGRGEINLSFTYELVNKKNSLSNITRTIPLILTQATNGQWSCFGVEEMGANDSYLEAFCRSFGIDYNLETGECSGAVTSESLREFCENIEGLSYNPLDKTCSGVPGSIELDQSCRAMDAIFDSSNKECNGFQFHTKREAICAVLHPGHTIDATDGRCLGVDYIQMKRTCEEAMKGTWNISSQTCEGAKKLKFEDICKSFGGEIAGVGNLTSPYTCDLDNQLSQVCDSINGDSGEYDQSTKKCSGVQSTFLEKACSSLGGTYRDNECFEVLDEQLQGFCTSMGGRYEVSRIEDYQNSTIKLGGSCLGVFETFGDICSLLGGQYNEQTKSCDEVEVGFMQKFCSALPGLTPECKVEYDADCPDGHIMIGSEGGKECVDLKELITDYGYQQIGSFPKPNCTGDENFVIGFDSNGVRCMKAGPFYYVAHSSDGALQAMTSISYSVPLNFYGAQMTSGQARNSVFPGHLAASVSNPQNITHQFEQITEPLSIPEGCKYEIPHKLFNYFGGVNLTCPSGGVVTNLQNSVLSETPREFTGIALTEGTSCPDLNVRVKSMRITMQCSEFVSEGYRSLEHMYTGPVFRNEAKNSFLYSFLQFLNPFQLANAGPPIASASQGNSGRGTVQGASIPSLGNEPVSSGGGPLPPITTTPTTLIEQEEQPDEVGNEPVSSGDSPLPPITTTPTTLIEQEEQPDEVGNEPVSSGDGPLPPITTTTTTLIEQEEQPDEVGNEPVSSGDGPLPPITTTTTTLIEQEELPEEVGNEPVSSGGDPLPPITTTPTTLRDTGLNNPTFGLGPVNDFSDEGMTQEQIHGGSFNYLKCELNDEYLIGLKQVGNKLYPYCAVIILQEQ
jgi:type II secretory pathway pseudopilin PulG